MDPVTNVGIPKSIEDKSGNGVPLPAPDKEMFEEPLGYTHRERVAAPSLAWLDRDLDSFTGVGSILVEDPSLVKAGEALLCSLFKGPDSEQPMVAALLALHLKAPESGKPMVEFPIVGQEGTKMGSLDRCISDNNDKSILKREGLLPDADLKPEDPQYGIKSMYSTHRDDDESAWQHAASNAIKAVRSLESESDQVAFYCLLGAVLMRLAVKTGERVKAQLGSLSQRFSSLYGGQLGAIVFDAISSDTLNFIASRIPIPSHIFSTVLYGFVKARSNPANVNYTGVLDYALLLHVAFNGMQLITLASNCQRALAFPNIGVMIKAFRCAEIDESLLRILQYFKFYHKYEEQSKYAPYCRLFRSDYWSSLSARNNVSCCAYFMAYLEKDNSEIWSMMSMATVSAEDKAKARLMAKRYRETRAESKVLKGIVPGGMFDLFAREPGSKPEYLARDPEVFIPGCTTQAAEKIARTVKTVSEVNVRSEESLEHLETEPSEDEEEEFIDEILKEDEKNKKI